MLPENWGRYAPDILWLKVGTLDWQGYQALNITHILNMPAHCVQGARVLVRTMARIIRK